MDTSGTLTDKELFDQPFWLEIATRLPELASNLEGADHLVDRFVGQYLPALLGSRAKADRDHVWLAFWHYLVAPHTRRKPFGLSSQTADLLIAEFQGALVPP